MVVVPKNFTMKELACPHCGKMEIGQASLDRLQRLRDRFGPMKLNSAYRCSEYNMSLGRTEHGPHTKGGFDVSVYGEKALQLVTLAIECGFTGIGVSQKDAQEKRFVHIDDLPNDTGQPRPWLWSY